MPPKTSSDNKKIKNDLEKLNKNEIKKVNVDLTKINLKTLTTTLASISDRRELYMYLTTSKRYYALNDRTLSLLMKGDLDMTATYSKDDEAPAIEDSDAEFVKIANVETNVEIFPVTRDDSKTRDGGAFFPYLNNTQFDFKKYGIFDNVDKHNYKHNCLYLALEAGGMSKTKLQLLTMTLKNRIIHKCDIENVCEVLDI